MGEIDLTV